MNLNTTIRNSLGKKNTLEDNLLETSKSKSLGNEKRGIKSEEFFQASNEKMVLDNKKSMENHEYKISIPKDNSVSSLNEQILVEHGPSKCKTACKTVSIYSSLVIAGIITGVVLQYYLNIAEEIGGVFKK